MIELLTTTAVIGTLSVVGIRSYQAQTNKARTAEAKHSLSYVYTAEKNFYDTWGTYHENLMVVGAVPSGTYHYDVGFGKSVTLSPTDGNLGDYPSKFASQILQTRECTNFYQTCDTGSGGCVEKTPKRDDITPPSSYFGAVTCTVTGGNYVKDYTGTDASNAKADTSGFKILALGELKNDDIWSIDQLRNVEHVEDGTQ